MRVSALLESMPGVGRVRARQIMDEVGIAETGVVGILKGGKPGPVFRKLWAVFQSRKPRAVAHA